MGRKSHAYVQELEPVCIGSGEEERFPVDSKVLIDGMNETTRPEAVDSTTSERRGGKEQKGHEW